MRRVLLVAVLVLGAGPALASGRNPQLPASGIVIHLFGPEAGVPERVAPAPAAGAAASVSSSGMPVAAGQAASAPAASHAAAAAQSDYPEPQWGPLLHEMFVTGDPNRGPGFPAGREKSY